MINVLQFRTDLPEFGDAQTYPDPQINYWLNIANLLLNVNLWGPSAATPWPASSPPPLALYDFGMEMYVAHNLALEQQALSAAGAGGVPGLSTGPVNSRSVDKVSVGYDTTAALEEGAGNWNLTVYGTRFFKLLQQVGSAPLQLGIGCAPAFSGGPWAGPPVWNFGQWPG